MQKNVICLLESGSQTHWGRFTLMRAAMLLKSIKIAWRTGDQIRVIFIGGGSPMTVNCLCLIQRGFWRLWGTSLGRLLVIQFLETMFNHCFAFFQRFVRSHLLNLTGLLAVGFIYILKIISATEISPYCRLSCSSCSVCQILVIG